jgi:CDP-diacylglycerol--serine O-phosphatidyltransferase
VAALVNVSPQPVDERTHAVVWLSLLIVLSFLMVSTFRYTSFKKVDLRSRRSYVNVVGIALLLIVFNMHPEWCLLALATLFWLSGPLAYLWGLVFRRRPGPPPVVAASEAP